MGLFLRIAPASGDARVRVEWSYTLVNPAAAAAAGLIFDLLFSFQRNEIAHVASAPCLVTDVQRTNSVALVISLRSVAVKRTLPFDSRLGA